MRRRSAGRPRRWSIGVSAAIALVVVVIAACGTSNSPACYAGDILYCTCLGGAAGSQACTANGSYGPCSCTDSGGAPVEAGPVGGDGATNLPYMATCFVVGTPGDCNPMNGDECFNFPNRGMYCTHPCTTNTDCALPSTGCNGMGVCKAPGATPPGGEAGAEGGADGAAEHD
jgi:hypothetical protein